jgi:N-acetyl-anhydromuramyl-L-alanine amidase AmpD
MRSIARTVTAVVAGSLGLALLAPPGAQATTTDRAGEFAAAAAEFGVPDDVLLAVSYNETRWEAHAGRPSTTGAYGPMGLTDVRRGAPSAKGDGIDPALCTLDAAAALLHVPPAVLRTDERQNIRGGAALLASRAHGDWYAAVTDYGGSAQFADDVYDTIRTGAARRTDDGQYLDLPAQPQVHPNRAPRPGAGPAECPANLSCDYVPAAYAQDSADPSDYGNYDLADRPNQHLTVNYIVIHDTESSYDSTVAEFQNPGSYVSANYVVQGSTGTVTQMVPDEDVAWQAGNWYVNTHSIGIEQVGYAVQGATWFTERLYRTTADLVRYLAARYHVPLDRQHIIGHDDVPGPTSATIAGMHWDPGPFWDWNHFMALLGRRTVPTAGPNSQVVTINPVFANNLQQVTDCESGTTVPRQPASFVYLHTAPSTTAPLFNDPGLNTGGTTCAADWGDKASAGQQFALAGRHGDWLAIWWDGSRVWFENPRSHPVVTPTRALVVVPKPGRTPVPTYGTAYPDATDFPPTIPVRTVSPLPYTLQPGQSYVLGGEAQSDYYYAHTIDNSAQNDHTDVQGTQHYIEIQLGHRIAFVNANDVLIHRS